MRFGRRRIGHGEVGRWLGRCRGDGGEVLLELGEELHDVLDDARGGVLRQRGLGFPVDDAVPLRAELVGCGAEVRGQVADHLVEVCARGRLPAAEPEEERDDGLGELAAADADHVVLAVVLEEAGDVAVGLDDVVDRLVEVPGEGGVVAEQGVGAEGEKRAELREGVLEVSELGFVVGIHGVHVQSHIAFFIHSNLLFILFYLFYFIYFILFYLRLIYFILFIY